MAGTGEGSPETLVPKGSADGSGRRGRLQLQKWRDEEEVVEEEEVQAGAQIIGTHLLNQTSLAIRMSI